MYLILKNFAGPVATVIAAFAEIFAPLSSVLCSIFSIGDGQ
jgi:hypothetical protein